MIFESHLISPIDKAFFLLVLLYYIDKYLTIHMLFIFIFAVYNFQLLLKILIKYLYSYLKENIFPFILGKYSRIELLDL